jgi:acyl-CoA synthetase (AMP-forming)/AMP-acid ligase II
MATWSKLALPQSGGPMMCPACASIFHVLDCSLPFTWGLYAGGTALILREFDPKERFSPWLNQCTVFMAVPTIHAVG